ncbi:MAG TPA: DUF72 domain-containing protein [Chitinophagaceae bacterium]|nr:DUF72 domain-containing protein [Chitinophagaceae bacterium]
MAKIKWEIGCSGFHYKEWKGIFYPELLPQKQWFKFYTETFNTLELNVTFYRFPVLKSLEAWYNTSPANFTFAVKAPRLITHYKKFTGCTRLIDDFYTLIAKGLKEKLGPVLFQLPPKYVYTNERLELIVKSMYKEFKNVIEFRDASWWTRQVLIRLKKENLIFCGIDYPGLPNDSIITDKTVYYRFHGTPRLYYSVYTKKDLKTVADEILANGKVTKAYIFFNNTATQAAIKNATWLKKYISIP